MDFEKCSEITKKKIIPVEENGRKLTIENPSQKKINKIRVDSCLINDHRERCDWVFEIFKKSNKQQLVESAIYLELKGKDLEKAYKQLAATLKYLVEKHRKIERLCYVICSRVPKASPKVQIQKAKFAKTHKVKLEVHTNKAKIKV